MEPLLVILLIALIGMLLIETVAYRKYSASVELLNTLGASIETAFLSVTNEINHTNLAMEVVERKTDGNIESLKITQNNLELVAIYLELFRDILAVDPERFKRLGTIKTTDTD